MTSAPFEASADAVAHNAPRFRGMAPADAIAVVFIAAIAGAFVQPRWPVGVVLLAGIAGVYAVFRVSRGRQLRRRTLAMTAVFVLALLVAAALIDSPG